MARHPSSELAKAISSARVVLPDPGSPMMMLIECSGIPPWSISSSSRLPVDRRLIGGASSNWVKSGDSTPTSASLDMLMFLHSRAPRVEELPNGVDQRVLCQGFQQE